MQELKEEAIPEKEETKSVRGTEENEKASISEDSVPEENQVVFNPTGIRSENRDEKKIAQWGRKQKLEKRQKTENRKKNKSQRAARKKNRK